MLIVLWTVIVTMCVVCGPLCFCVCIVINAIVPLKKVAMTRRLKPIRRVNVYSLSKEARREGDWLLIRHDQLWPHFDLCYILTFIFFRIYEGFAILTVELEMLRLEGVTALRAGWPNSCFWFWAGTNLTPSYQDQPNTNSFAHCIS